MNKLQCRIVKWPMTVRPVANMTSEGLTLPEWLNTSEVRIKVMVITMVAKTTTVAAPKVRDTSFRMEE
jgi:hypothetical protein